jgi:Apea-like HEPN
LNKRLIGLIPNKKFTLPSGIPLQLECRLKLARIEDKYFACIYRHDEVGFARMTPNHYAIRIDPDHEVFDGIDISDLARANCFVLNFFASKGFISEPIFYSCDGVKSIKIKGPLPGAGMLVPESYAVDFEIKAGTTSAEVESVLIGCLGALKKDKGMKVTIDRFIQAMAKPDQGSKAVDLAICLESLFPFETEISFRFALFGALFSASDVEKRQEIYKLLKEFYTLRSRIVHGSSDLEKSMSKLDGRWESVFEVARYVILYKFNFLATNAPGDWAGHLEKVVLGQGQLGAQHAA